MSLLLIILLIVVLLGGGWGYSSGHVAGGYNLITVLLAGVLIWLLLGAR